MNKILVFILSLILLILPMAVRAQQTPTHEFPSCPQGGGRVIASYPTGTHWIAGEDSLREGSDTVYQLEDGNVLQCFCPTDITGSGIKTEWLDSKDMSEEEKQSYVDNGWIVINNGADFGLEEHCYLAKNIPFSCSNPTPAPTCSPAPSTPLTAPISGQSSCNNQPDPTPVPSDPPTSSSNSNSNSNQGSVLGISSPTSLPGTGTQAVGEIAITLIASLSSLGYGIYLKKKN